MQIDLLGQAMIEVTEEDADAIVAEVDALGATDAIGGPAPDRRTLTVTNENAAVILRALDHVRNAGHSHRAAQDARDSLLRYLRSVPPRLQAALVGVRWRRGTGVLELHGHL